MLKAIAIFPGASLLRVLMATLMTLVIMLSVIPVHAEETKPVNDNDSTQILQAFNRQHREAEHAKSITDKDKQRIMFLLGVALLALVLITGGLGIAMGLYGKQVFVAHMICAGLSMTLAVAHAIVGIVWFYPF